MGDHPSTSLFGEDLDDLQAPHRQKNLDSQITDQVLTVATNLDLPVLGIHDSFIVARAHQETLLHIINTATRELLGVELPVAIAEAAPVPVRSRGYLDRLRG